MNRFAFLIIASLALIVTAGCGGKQPLRGKVTFADDGAPLTVGTVCFVDRKHMSRGPLKSDGSYVVQTLGKKDGIRPGSYLVFIADAADVETDANGNITLKPLIASKYTSEETSGLTFEADGKTKVFDIVVERP